MRSASIAATNASVAEWLAVEMFTAKLKPGRYELVCFMPGHHAAGQKLPFTVK